VMVGRTWYRLQPPGARSLYNAGIRALVSDGLNGCSCATRNLRSAWDAGAGVSEIFEEGDIAEVHFSRRDPHQRTGAEVRGMPLPRMLMNIVDAGGIRGLLRGGLFTALEQPAPAGLHKQTDPMGAACGPNSHGPARWITQHHSTWRERMRALLANVRAGADSRRREGYNMPSSRNREREPTGRAASTARSVAVGCLRPEPHYEACSG